MNRPNYYLLYGLALVLALAESTLVYHLQWRTFVPELLFALALFWAFQTPPEEAIIHIWAIGFMKDLFSITAPGFHALLFVLAILPFSFVRNFLYTRSYPVLVLSSFLILVFINFFHTGLRLLSGANLYPFLTVLQVGGHSLYSALLGGLLLFVMIQYEDVFGFYKVS